MTEINTTPIIASAMNDDEKPDIKTRRILIAISKKYGIEKDDIKARYKEIRESKELEEEGLPLDRRDRWVVNKLVWLLNDENDIDNYKHPIEVYCDLISELAIINDKMARTSIGISRVFGEKYNFVKALKEVDHIRRSLENRMNKNFFDGE